MLNYNVKIGLAPMRRDVTPAREFSTGKRRRNMGDASSPILKNAFSATRCPLWTLRGSIRWI